MSLLYPPMLDWEVTPFCNHNCIHCYNYWRTSYEITKSEELSKTRSESYYYNIAKKIVDCKPVSVIITGGEPFLIFDKIASSIDLLLNNNIVVSINTNATLLTDQILSFLKERNISLFVSLPCANAEICDRITGVKDSLKRISTSLRKIISANIDVSVNMVVSKINKDYVYSTAEFVKNELGLMYLCATRAYLPANARNLFNDSLLTNDEFNDFLDTLIRVKNTLGMDVDSAWAYSLCGIKNLTEVDKNIKLRSCSAGMYSFSITSDGKIKACVMDNKTYGDIICDSFSDAIERMSKWQDGSFLPDKCAKCDLLSKCHSGCRCDALISNGSMCVLDSTANDVALTNYCDTDSVLDTDLISNNKYQINPFAIFVQEVDMVRCSCGRKFDYISKEFYDFLSHSNSIDISDIMDTFDISRDETAEAVSRLIELDVLIPT